MRKTRSFPAGLSSRRVETLVAASEHALGLLALEERSGEADLRAGRGGGRWVPPENARRQWFLKASERAAVNQREKRTVGADRDGGEVSSQDRCRWRRRSGFSDGGGARSRRRRRFPNRPERRKRWWVPARRSLEVPRSAGGSGGHRLADRWGDCPAGCRAAEARSHREAGPSAKVASKKPVRFRRWPALTPRC